MYAVADMLSNLTSTTLFFSSVLKALMQINLGRALQNLAKEMIVELLTQYIPRKDNYIADCWMLQQTIFPAIGNQMETSQHRLDVIFYESPTTLIQLVSLEPESRRWIAILKTGSWTTIT